MFPWFTVAGIVHNEQSIGPIMGSDKRCNFGIDLHLELLWNGIVDSFDMGIVVELVLQNFLEPVDFRPRDEIIALFCPTQEQSLYLLIGRRVLVVSLVHSFTPQYLIFRVLLLVIEQVLDVQGPLGRERVRFYRTGRHVGIFCASTTHQEEI